MHALTLSHTWNGRYWISVCCNFIAKELYANKCIRARAASVCMARLLNDISFFFLLLRFVCIFIIWWENSNAKLEHTRGQYMITSLLASLHTFRIFFIFIFHTCMDNVISGNVCIVKWSVCVLCVLGRSVYPRCCGSTDVSSKLFRSKGNHIRIRLNRNKCVSCIYDILLRHNTHTIC